MHHHGKLPESQLLSTAETRVQWWVLGSNSWGYESGHLEKASSALFRGSKASCGSLLCSGEEWQLAPQTVHIRELSSRQGHGHQQSPVCHCLPEMLPQTLLTPRLLGTFCPQVRYSQEHMQTVSARGSGETPGFLQPLAAPYLTHKLVNVSVCVFVPWPWAACTASATVCTSKCWAVVRTPLQEGGM